MSKEVIEIIESFNASNLTRLRVKKGKLEIELEKNANSISSDISKVVECADEKFILSPVVGKYTKSLVHEGDFVKKGDVLCIIEAMKTFNEIYADYDCVIDKIIVKDNTFVECNQKLMVVIDND